jgi:polyisoprenyl-phosphate glycosyltransferase
VRDRNTHQQKIKRITIITPIYNEEESIPLFYNAIKTTTETLPYVWSILFVNDGSTDSSAQKIEALARQDTSLGYIEFSRNFGKEAATTAGLHACEGDAAILIDSDLQHPVELIPVFLERWESGHDVVVGVRESSQSDSPIKRTGSRLFYKLMHLMAETEMVPRATDYRLLDRSVIDEFKRFTEHERMTRGLIDWLGYKRSIVPFKANERVAGTAQYSIQKLWQLAISSFVSHSLVPLRVAGYLGVFIVVCSIPLGIVMVIDHYFYPLGFNFSGPAMLADIILFLIGIVLICMGLLAYYIGHIYQETRNRPIYVVRRSIQPK